MWKGRSDPPAVPRTAEPLVTPSHRSPTLGAGQAYGSHETLNQELKLVAEWPDAPGSSQKDFRRTRITAGRSIKRMGVMSPGSSLPVVGALADGARQRVGLDGPYFTKHHETNASSRQREKSLRASEASNPRCGGLGRDGSESISYTECRQKLERIRNGNENQRDFRKKASLSKQCAELGSHPRNTYGGFLATGEENTALQSRKVLREPWPRLVIPGDGRHHHGGPGAFRQLQEGEPLIGDRVNVARRME